MGGVGVRRGGRQAIGEWAFQETECVCTRRTHGLCPKPRAEKGFVSPSGRKRHAWESRELRKAEATCSHVCGCELTLAKRREAWTGAGDRICAHGWLSPSAAHLRLSQHCLLPGSTLVHKKYLKKEKKHSAGTSLAVQWLRPHFPVQGVRVQTRVGKLRSHMTHGPKNQNVKQKQNCNKCNKDFKSGG